jgi:cystathionine beta-synthase
MRPIKKVYENILETIGNTPMIRLNKIVEDFPCDVLAKVEYFNPGNSVKDRMALTMIENAEKEGLLKPGGTIIECTSGNTGMGLALAAIVKGYKLICTLSDKQSVEKMDVLRAMGAEIHVCPTSVPPEHPESYYSVANRLHKDIPNSYYPFQYDNPGNAQAHYDSTGPEIWEQTDGKITHFVVGVGTGGTISGVGKYLKEKNPDINIWGIDSYGSVFKKYHETGEFDEKEIYSYITEGIEGLFLGYSCGSAFQGLRQLKDQLKPEDVVVVLFHDHGSRYVGKVYNDDWMRDRGFLTTEDSTAGDLVKGHAHLPLVSVDPQEVIAQAIAKMKNHSISQIPVMKDGEMVGSLDDSKLFQSLMADPSLTEKFVENIMEAPFPIVQPDEAVKSVAKHISKDVSAVMVSLPTGGMHIITKQDIINALS